MKRNTRVVLIEEVAPTAIAKLRGALGRVDDVGEQHRREESFVFDWCSTFSGHELLDEVNDGVGVAEPGDVIGAIEDLEP